MTSTPPEQSAPDYQPRPFPDPALGTVKKLGLQDPRTGGSKAPEDWLRQHHYRPVLMETFVHKSRFAGTCYKAANWHYLGET